MISRYALYDTALLRDRFAPGANTPKGVRPRYNVSPGMDVPVIVSRDGGIAIERMLWGFVPAGAKDINSLFRYKSYAIRSEKILDTHTYRAALRSQRCLIPVNGYYEWKKTAGGDKPFYISHKAEGPAAVAGIYGEWTDPAGAVRRMCSVITIDNDAGDDMTPSNLPVFVAQADEAAWLDPAISDLSTIFGIVRAPDTDSLTILPVNDAVNSTKVDKPELIERRIAI